MTSPTDRMRAAYRAAIAPPPRLCTIIGRERLNDYLDYIEDDARLAELEAAHASGPHYDMTGDRYDLLVAELNDDRAVDWRMHELAHEFMSERGCVT